MAKKVRWIVTDSCFYHPSRGKSDRSTHWIELVALDGPNAGRVKYLKCGSVVQIVSEKK